MIEIGLAKCESDEIALYSKGQKSMLLTQTQIRFLSPHADFAALNVPNDEYSIQLRCRTFPVLFQVVIQLLGFLLLRFMMPSYYYRNAITLSARSALNPQQMRVFKLGKLDSFSRKPHEISFILEWINRAYLRDPIKFSRTLTIERAFGKFKTERRLNTDVADWIDSFVESETDG